MSLEESLKSLSLDYLNLLINGQAFSDVTFSVEGRLVHAHRCILAARSLFFRKYFCGPDPPAGLDPASSRMSPGSASSSPRGGNSQKQLASMVEKASIEDVMKVLIASRKQDMHQLWTTCSHLVAKSGLPPEVLAKHLPIDVVAKIDELRLKSSLARRSLMSHHHHHHHHDLSAAAADLEDQKIRRMRRALDSSDVELVKLMVMGEGLNLDEALALHYAVENCSREVVKALLELGAADVNYPAGPARKTPLHVAAEMVCPDMVAVLLDHHADPNVRTVDGITPLDVLRTLTSDFLFKGAIPGLSHIEPNKLRLCLELVQSAALVLSREEGSSGGGGGGNASSTTPIYPPMNNDPNTTNNSNSMGMVNLSLDSRMVYLNLGAAAAAQLGCKIDGEDDENSHNRQREAMNRHGSSGCNTSMYQSHDY
ncbi:BTB/POZ domain and ankyrin repeat-containing protein NOOT2-like isoform X3 [Macadamia integrifolia]|uniref:BTB/POZ domain and ankyrin repeat-containing protein NOOT2-like isoform X3 n=1 Tax=Macadamia integrifolia TaxID=60698 RepID=UPI001C4E4824|nr:BTB/POZ domain and ankyrin repeat-containing protein NOOT2-like isoform X3 [Macadamia integrifolia]